MHTALRAFPLLPLQNEIQLLSLTYIPCALQYMVSFILIQKPWKPSKVTKENCRSVLVDILLLVITRANAWYSFPQVIRCNIDLDTLLIYNKNTSSLCLIFDLICRNWFKSYDHSHQLKVIIEVYGGSIFFNLAN